MLISVLELVGGLVVLYLGAEFFIKGASGIAKGLGVSPFVIGLTVVGFGTSAPELAVNVAAALNGTYDVAMGNVVGSNICNIGLILGVAALIRPLIVHMRLLVVEAPVMIAVALLLWGLGYDGNISRTDSAILLGCFLVLTILTYRSARREPPAIKEEIAHAASPRPRNGLSIFMAIGGMVGLVLGAELMVTGAVALARAWGMSEITIGLTIIAIGTSLPELASSVIAAFRNEADIAVGNVVGSNIFNILLILGTTAAIHPLPVPTSFWWTEIPIMILFSFALIPIMMRTHVVNRIEGFILLMAFASFIAWQVTGKSQ